MTAYPYVDLDEIRIDRRVMKLLPPEIAYHYHALPIATDGKQVTVAMASPSDPTACRVLESVIEAPICLIQAELSDIDHWLHRLWPEIPARMKFLYWSNSTSTNQGASFAECFAGLLRADLIQVECSEKREESVAELEMSIQQVCPDMIIFQTVRPDRAIKRLTACPSIDKTDCLPDLFILPVEPELPIRKVLLILPDSGAGYETASSWVVRISTPNKIEAIVLPVLPLVPQYFGSFLRYDLDSLMAGKDPLGKRMRSISDIFSAGNIRVSYKLLEGDPIDQIRDELKATNPDMIILPSPSQRIMKKWSAMDLISTLTKSIETPILITQ
jgi:hypothetical protein